MRPRPQCDTVKWQESVAGEPLVRGIYHLKPSDPLCLWEGRGEVDSEWEAEAEVEERKVTKKSRMGRASEKELERRSGANS